VNAVSAKQPLLIYGASGHGKVVADAALGSGSYEVQGFLDDDRAKWGQTALNLPILGGVDCLRALATGGLLALGIGSNERRKRIFEELSARGMTWATIVHRSAVVASGVRLGEGSFVGPLAVVHTDASVGRGCIINSGAVVEHDNVLGDWVHVGPGSTLAGNVHVGTGTQIGLGARVLPGIRVGEWAVVGAGAVVTREVPARMVAIGVPARVNRTKHDPE
jgi:sugar O-acyltransferase (sialic acid O-acetyltransferase NeuD family)